MKKKQAYTEEQQIAFLKSDLINDAECAERQAERGPYFPDKNITRETLLAYAADCRAMAAKSLTPKQLIQFIENKI